MFYLIKKQSTKEKKTNSGKTGRATKVTRGRRETRRNMRDMPLAARHDLVTLCTCGNLVRTLLLIGRRVEHKMNFTSLTSHVTTSRLPQIHLLIHGVQLHRHLSGNGNGGVYCCCCAAKNTKLNKLIKIGRNFLKTVHNFEARAWTPCNAMSGVFSSIRKWSQLIARQLCGFLLLLWLLDAGAKCHGDSSPTFSNRVEK